MSRAWLSHSASISPAWCLLPTNSKAMIPGAPPSVICRSMTPIAAQSATIAIPSTINHCRRVREIT